MLSHRPWPLLLLALCACRATVESDGRMQADLLAELRAHRPVAVMIALVEPSGYGDPTIAPRWRAEIARLQAEVVASLDTADYRHGQSFASIPAMSGVIRSERGLQSLLAHPHVRRVDPDEGGTGARRTSTGD